MIYLSLPSNLFTISFIFDVITLSALVSNSIHLDLKYADAPIILPPTVKVCAIYINTPVAMLKAFKKNDKKAIRIPLPIITIAMT